MLTPIIARTILFKESMKLNNITQNALDYVTEAACINTLFSAFYIKPRPEQRAQFNFARRMW